MAFTAKELTHLVGETNKARQVLDKVLDYVDLVNKNIEGLPEGTKDSLENIDEQVSIIGKKIEEVKKNINAELNKIPVDPADVKTAAEKLQLYHANINEVIHWASTQLSGHEENSYWWKYWKGVCDIVVEQQVKQQQQ